MYSVISISEEGSIYFEVDVFTNIDNGHFPLYYYIDTCTQYYTHLSLNRWALRHAVPKAVLIAYNITGKTKLTKTILHKTNILIYVYTSKYYLHLQVRRSNGR